MTGSTEDDEPAAKRKKSNGPSDPVFGSRESKFPARRTVYSDGSSKGNGKRGAVAGSGVFWSHEPGAKYKFSSRSLVSSESRPRD